MLHYLTSPANSIQSERADRPEEWVPEEDTTCKNQQNIIEDYSEIDQVWENGQRNVVDIFSIHSTDSTGSHLLHYFYFNNGSQKGDRILEINNSSNNILHCRLNSLNAKPTVNIYFADHVYQKVPETDVPESSSNDFHAKKEFSVVIIWKQQFIDAFMVGT